MAEKIRIAELDIDAKALIQTMTETKAAIDEVSESQKELKKQGDTSSETFVKNEAKLKSLRQEYGAQQKVLQAVQKSNNQYNAALQKEIKSVDDAAKNNKELKQVRNQLNATTEEGAAAIAEINKKIDENNGFIKKNTSEVEQNRQNVGNYKSALDKARIGVIAFGAALKAAGIGLIIAAFAKLRDTFNGNRKAADFFSTAANVLSIILNDIVTLVVDNVGKIGDFFSDPLQGVKDLGQAIKDNIIERFNSILEVGGFVGDALRKLFSGDFAGAVDSIKEAGKEMVDVFTGVDDSLDKATEFVTEYGTEVLSAATALTELNNNAIEAIALNRKLKEEYEREAEQLRQLRDDITKTDEERLAASEKIVEVLDKRAELSLRNADLAIRQAEAERELTDTAENRAAVIDAQAEKAAILNQIESQRSEQLRAQNTLEKEIADRRAAETQAELDRELAKNEKLRALRDEFLLEEAELAIAEAERKAEAHLLELETLELQETEKAELEKAIIADKEAEIAEITMREQSKLAAMDKKLQQEKLDNRRKTLDGILALTNAETGIGKAALIAKQLLAIKEQAVNLGLFKSKAALAQSEVIVDTAKGTTKSAASAPFPANLPLIAGFLASIAGVGSAIKSAVSGAQSAKFARGGILRGRSHANGGIPTPFGELEGGEAVINKRSTKLFKPILSRLNEAGGGKKFAEGGILGDATTRSAGGDFINYDLLAEKVAEANMSLPNPVVGVNEVVEVADRVEAIETAGDF